MLEDWQQTEGAVLHRRRAQTDAERAQLQREATMLTLARHPAVVQVVRAGPRGSELVTRAAATSTLDGARPAAPVSPGPSADRGGHPTAAALSSAAEALADLHALGLVHGGLRADTIWVDDRGQAILDGFHNCGLAGEVDAGGGPRRPSTDVRALVELVHLADAEPTLPTGRGAWAWGRRRGPARRRGHESTGHELAAVLAAGRAGSWPPARRLAQVLEQEAARGARRGPPPDRSATPTPARTHPAVGPRRLAAPSAPRRPGPADPEPAEVEAPDPFAHLRPPQPLSSPRVHRAPLLAAVAGVVGLAALSWGVITLTANPARPSLRPRQDSPVVAVDGTAYRIGQPGDQVRIGAWGCRPARAVVLRPDTGEVFAFRGWARPGHDLVARQVARVAPGSRLVGGRLDRGCPSLSATSPDGASTVLDAEVTQ